MSILSILTFILLFLALCIFLVMFFSITNVYFKSYKPKNTLFVLVPTFIVFLVMLFLSSLNFIRVAKQVQKVESQVLTLK